MRHIGFFQLLIACSFGAIWLNRDCFALDLVKDGRPVATIVVAGDRAAEMAKARRQGRSKTSLSSDADAARVLNDWIGKITDVELPIANSAPDGSPAIYIGSAALRAGLNLSDIQSASSEGLRIVVKGQRALMGGQNDAATVRAVCRFLEKLGCRYFMDHELGEVYPRTRNLSVQDMEIAEQPGFVSRKIWGSNWSGETLWKIWNGAGGIPMETGHSWARYVPAAKYYGSHPEYFSVRNGERRKGEWLCTSNADVQNLFADAVAVAIRRGDVHPSISPPDGRGYCECKVCRAQDDPSYLEPSSGTPVMSDRFVDFLDGIGKRIRETYPNSILNFYAYADYTQPPIHHGPVSRNLCVWLAPIRYCRFHAIQSDCPNRRGLGDVITGWAKVVSQLAYREYNYNLAEALTPIPKISVWKRDVPYLRQRGFVGVNFESIASWCIYGPHMYLSIRLAYDPAADAEALMNDYYAMFFGPDAGPLMKQYWETLDDKVANLPHHTGSFYALQHVFTPEILARCRTFLNQAAEAAGKDATYLARVQMCAAGFANAEKYIQLWNAENAGDWTQAKTVYDQLIEQCDSLIRQRYANPYTKSYLERFVGPAVKDGYTLTRAPNKMILQLPDIWRFCYDVADEGTSKGFQRNDYDDGAWQKVKTYSATLLQQSIPEQQTIMWYRTRFDLRATPERLVLWFAEVDGDVRVFVNGVEVGKSAQRRKPFIVDIAQAACAGENVVAVRVDHRQTTELYLGGILRPVALMQAAAVTQ